MRCSHGREIHAVGAKKIIRRKAKKTRIPYERCHLEHDQLWHT